MSKKTFAGVQHDAAMGRPKPPATAPHWQQVADASGRKK